LWRKIGESISAGLFRRFGIRLVCGPFREIKPREVIRAGNPSAQESVFVRDDAKQIRERDRHVSLMRMESIEPLEGMPPKRCV
jgi:hypothetical protein